ncbi:MAG: MMPL family transporter [Planctomycetaceae bacterium]
MAANGEFAFLPDDAPSVLAQETYRRAFLNELSSESRSQGAGSGAFWSLVQDPLGSNIVLVVRREDRADGLQPADYDFVRNHLLKQLAEIQRTTPKSSEVMRKDWSEQVPANEQIIRATMSFTDESVGPLLVSEDGHAGLVLITLQTEFLDMSNRVVAQRIEEMLADPGFRREMMQGLDIKPSGSAIVGRDMLQAERTSASRTESSTIVLVVVLLLFLYRAPILALIPLITVGMAVSVTKGVLAILSSWGWVSVFNGLETYVTVVVYGAGVDYCLFLIARYKEELDHGHSFHEAIAAAVGRVGSALATSAGTSIVGIGMMMFAEFGKFRQAGLAISLGLAIVLLASITLTPAFLVLFRRVAFWPDMRSEQIAVDSGWMPTLSLTALLDESQLLRRGWEWIGRQLLRQPGRIFLVVFACCLPFAIMGYHAQDKLSYGLLSDLPQQDPSVVGAKAVQTNFPAGVTGVITVLIRYPDIKPDDPAAHVGREITEKVANHLLENAERLGVDYVRCERYPMGTSKQGRDRFRSLSAREVRIINAKIGKGVYESTADGLVLRIDVVTDQDPFTRTSMDQLDRIEKEIGAMLPASPEEMVNQNSGGMQFDAEGNIIEPAEATSTSDPPIDQPIAASPEQSGTKDLPKKEPQWQIATLGPTASLRDLKSSTDRDRVLIDILVVISVYLLLVLLLRQPAVCAYLIVSVVFSYLVTMGFTYLVFWGLYQEGFSGLDWKVPIYLFTILIAMGEDYNILLMARVVEEQKTHGNVGGVIVALTKTGSIISSCGIIMAGTFGSLMMGSLMGMIQLGFALAFGVLLDTFLVRPILVPAYLVLLHSGRLGPLGSYLGALPSTPSDSDAVAE